MGLLPDRRWSPISKIMDGSLYTVGVSEKDAEENIWTRRSRKIHSEKFPTQYKKQNPYLQRTIVKV
jgi:hypothetical protein